MKKAPRMVTATVVVLAVTISSACSGGSDGDVGLDVGDGDTYIDDSDQSDDIDSGEPSAEFDETQSDGSGSAVPFVEGSGSCAFETRTNTGLAYEYGVPSGWLSFEKGGTLMVTRDGTARTSALVYTALLQRENDPSWFLNAYVSALSEGLAADGGGFEFDAPTGSGSSARVDVYGFVGGSQVVGEAEASVAGGFVTAKVIWSDVSTWGEDREILGSVTDCYQRFVVLDDEQLRAVTAASKSPIEEPVASSNPWGSLTQKYENGFSYAAPSSWSSVGSQGDGVTSVVAAAPANDAAVVFVFLLGRFQPSNELIIDNLFRSFGITADFGPSSETIAGASLYDFVGDVAGQQARGMVAIRNEPYLTFFANYISMAMSTTSQWDVVKGTLAEIASTGTVTDASSNLSQLPPLPNLSVDRVFGSSFVESTSYRSAVEDQASQNWSEAMRGYVTVESPSTGERWDVPLNSYNSAGGGFYRSLPGGGVEKLVQP